jgi:hypothetical protein
MLRLIQYICCILFCYGFPISTWNNFILILYLFLIDIFFLRILIHKIFFLFNLFLVNYYNLFLLFFLLLSFMFLLIILFNNLNNTLILWILQGLFNDLALNLLLQLRLFINRFTLGYQLIFLLGKCICKNTSKDWLSQFKFKFFNLFSFFFCLSYQSLFLFFYSLLFNLLFVFFCWLII